MYNIVTVINNTVLYTEIFVKRIDLTLNVLTTRK